jgi:putative FmdB family regulatory protein
MPLYEYVCQGCQAKIELLLRGAQQPVCPQCGGRELEKQFSVPVIGSRSASLPIAGLPQPGTCGRPQCAMGGCQGLE